jgi:hypothetical protein
VKAQFSDGKKKGAYFGRAAVEAGGSFNVKTKTALIQGISYKNCILVQSNDGYEYHF